MWRICTDFSFQKLFGTSFSQETKYLTGIDWIFWGKKIYKAPIGRYMVDLLNARWVDLCALSCFSKCVDSFVLSVTFISTGLRQRLCWTVTGLSNPERRLP